MPVSFPMPKLYLDLCGMQGQGWAICLHHGLITHFNIDVLVSLYVQNAPLPPLPLESGFPLVSLWGNPKRVP